MLRDDSIDYAVYTASIPKKRQTPRNPRVRKAAAVRGEEEEGDDDYWSGGPRNLDFSSPRSSGGGRVTRSRSHL